MKEFILNEMKASNIITKSGQINKQAKRMLTIRFHGLLRSLITQTGFLPDKSSVRLRIMCLINGIEESGKCKVCSGNTNFDFSNNKFYDFCVNKKGQSCAAKDKELQNKRKENITKKYGVDNVLKNKEIRQKIKNTNQKKYGGPSPMNCQTVRDKRKDTIKNKS